MKNSVQRRPAAKSAPDAKGLTVLLKSVLHIIVKASQRQNIDPKAVIADAVRATGAETSGLDAGEGRAS